MRDKELAAIEQHLRRLRKPRALRLRRTIDVEVLEHAMRMMRQSEKALGFKVLHSSRTKWAAIVYNRLILELVTTQEQLDEWFLKCLRERAGTSEKAA